MCYYRFCPHKDNSYDFVDEFDREYHNECYQNERDLLLFENIWMQRKGRIQVAAIRRAETEMINLGYSPDYMIFGLDYACDHNYKLNYPAGLKFYLAREEVKSAYDNKKYIHVKKEMKEKIEKSESKPMDLNDPITKPKISYKKERKFTSILNRENK